MRRGGAGIRLSASDLMRFTECRYATWRDLERLRGRGPEPAARSEDAALLQKHGEAHEAAYLEKLRAKGRSIVMIGRGSFEAQLAETEAALRAGAEVVAQGALGGGMWGGYADFLERVPLPSDLGNYSYEAVDAKLKRTPAPSHVMQLALYSDLLAGLQGRAPEFAHVHLGTDQRHTLRIAEYAAYVNRARRRLERFIRQPGDVRPVPCAACSLCAWREHCDGEWERKDSLFRVAGIRRDQVGKLEAAGVSTLEALARRAEPVRKLAHETLDKLRAQARLQQARKTGSPSFELRERVDGKGFDLLPRPAEGDLFYDIEGYTYYSEPGEAAKEDRFGLEYLHGVWDGMRFEAFWAHSRKEEGRALEQLFALFSRSIAENPQARIYHYAPYEITALRRLTARHGCGEAQLDRWLREGRFVDLYSVVRSGLVSSEMSYSIKDMEAFYDLPREGDVKSAGASIVAYELFRETGDGKILGELEDYNRIDCISTAYLRNWLLEIRPSGPWPELTEAETEKSEESLRHSDELRQLLNASDLEGEQKKLLYDLSEFHRREAKPAAWAVFDAKEKEEEELMDDMNCLAGLAQTGHTERVKRSVQVEYAYPAQATKLRPGSRVTVLTADGFMGVEIADHDRKKQRVMVKVGAKKVQNLPSRIDLLPDFALNTDVIRSAIGRIVEDRCGEGRFKAVADLLARCSPRFAGKSPLPIGRDHVAGLREAVRTMDCTVLPVQGPPGTGKTYVAARAILGLVRDGHRVAVTSNSHAAILNLLTGCVEAGGDGLSIVHKAPVGATSPHPAITFVTKNNAPELKGAQIVGGTAWLFARKEQEGAFGYLFVDEAGQVSLANLVGMAHCARNLVLVGDPRQLPQVTQGAHPPGADLSCLEWMLGEGQNVEEDRGILLNVTWRMHPDLCAFVSEQFYRGLIRSHASTALQAVKATGVPRAGAFLAPVEHAGRMQHAPEEVEAIRAMIERILGGTWTDRQGRSRPLVTDDIIVVAPYNAQVQALSDGLPGIRVGTVDRFQGQEAPVALVSMTDSAIGESSRGLEFLLSRERLNVAISRGKALSMVFASPDLLQTPCATVGQMRLVNALCALPEFIGLGGP